MTIWFWLHFFSFLFYVLIGAYILGCNPKDYLNRLVSILMLCFALWSFGNAMMFNNFVTIEDSKIMLKIAAPGWIFFSSVALLFILEFINKSNISRDKLKILIILIPPTIFYLLNLFDQFLFCCDKTFYGYTGRWRNILWVKLFYVYYSSYVIISFYLLLKYIINEKNKAKKNTAIILLGTMIFCFLSGTLTSVILKEMKNYVPLEANNFLIVFAIGIIYAMNKYQFLVITPYKALEHILNTINEGLILLDNEGKIKDTNNFIFKIFEIEKSEDKAKVKDYLEDIIKNKLSILDNKPIIDENIKIKTILNNIKDILFSGTVIKEKNEKIGYLIILRDITELKITKKELELAFEKLMESNKELERFAFIASHDLKEPLRMITSYIQLLQKKYKNKLDRDADDYINYIVDGAERMNRLINNLLEYSKVVKKEMEIEEVDTKKLLEEVIDILKFKIKQKGAIIRIENELPIIKANKLEIFRVFQNLIDNALKFNKSIPQILIKCKKEKDYFLFSISDNGIGLKPEYKEKIFELFTRNFSEYEFEGNGIGLAITKKIIEKHNGKIWVESEGPNKGATFYFTIPY